MDNEQRAREIRRELMGNAGRGLWYRILTTALDAAEARGLERAAEKCDKRAKAIRSSTRDAVIARGEIEDCAEAIRWEIEALAAAPEDTPAPSED